MTEKLKPHEVWTAIAGALAEWLFAMLPLVVVAIVMFHEHKASAVLESPEWAFGASILSGQALVRFVAGIARSKKLALDRVLLGISAVLVGVVGPANIVLALVILSEARKEHVSGFLVTSQALLFLVSSLVFILVASFVHLWSKRSTVAASQHE